MEEKKERQKRKENKTDKIPAFQEMMCTHKDINIAMKCVLLIHKFQVQNTG